MARTTYVLRDGDLIEKHLAAPLHHADAAPMIRPDGMEAVRSMADGRVYESRSAYYASVRTAGCEIVGDDRAPFERRPVFDPGAVAPDIARAMEQLGAR